MAETTVDAANGLSITVLFIWATILGLTFEYMVFGPMGPHGTFWFFSFVCLMFFFWIWCVPKETRGLSSLEKKTLYAPVNKTVTETELKAVLHTETRNENDMNKI